MARATLLFLLALPACTSEYHPEYHPETVYSYVQTIKVEQPRQEPAPTIVFITQAPPPPEPAPRAPPRPAHAFVRHAQTVEAAVAAPSSASAFQAAPVFAADDRAQ